MNESGRKVLQEYEFTMAPGEYDPSRLKVGDVLTFSNHFEPEGAWGWLMRRLGKRTAPRKLREYTVTFADVQMTFYEPKSQGDEG